VKTTWPDSCGSFSGFYDIYSASDVADQFYKAVLPGGSYGASMTNLNMSDDGAVQMELPFRMEFAGRVYDTLSVQANGVIVFQDRVLYAGDGLDSLEDNEYVNTHSTLPLIAAYWAILNPADGGGVYITGAQRDSNNNTNVVIVYENVAIYDSTAVDGSTVTFEVKLYACGDIRINYVHVPEPVDNLQVGFRSEFAAFSDEICKGAVCEGGFELADGNSLYLNATSDYGSQNCRYTI
jgi:hypothetical protein